MNTKNIALILVILAIALGIYCISQHYLHNKKNIAPVSQSMQESENVKIQIATTPDNSKCTGNIECESGTCDMTAIPEVCTGCYPQGYGCISSGQCCPSGSSTDAVTCCNGSCLLESYC